MYFILGKRPASLSRDKSAFMGFRATSEYFQQLKSIIIKRRGVIYLVMPTVYSILGRTTCPVIGSMGGRISKVARTFEIVSQMMASAKCRPGQILKTDMRLAHITHTVKIAPPTEPENKIAWIVHVYIPPLVAFFRASSSSPS